MQAVRYPTPIKAGKWVTGLGAGLLFAAACSETDPSRQGMFPFGPQSEPNAGVLAIDTSGRTIYGVTGDPRTNGIVVVDVATAAETSPAWNLDLIPVGEFPVAVEYADH